MKIKFDYLLPPEAMDYAVKNPDERCITKIKLIITPENPAEKPALLAWAKQSKIPCIIDSKSNVVLPNNEPTVFWAYLSFKQLECLKKGSLTTEELVTFWSDRCVQNPNQRDEYRVMVGSDIHIASARIIDALTGYGGVDGYRSRHQHAFADSHGSQGFFAGRTAGFPPHPDAFRGPSAHGPR